MRIAFFQRVARHSIGFESGLAFAGPAVQLPVVPRTNQVVTVKMAVTERPACRGSAPGAMALTNYDYLVSSMITCA